MVERLLQNHYMVISPQVTLSSVRLVCPSSKELVATWTPPGGKLISVCGCNSAQFLAARGSILFYLEIQVLSLLNLYML